MSRGKVKQTQDQQTALRDTKANTGLLTGAVSVVPTAPAAAGNRQSGEKRAPHIDAPAGRRRLQG